MMKFLFVFSFLILPSTYASSLEDLKKQTKEPLYFSIPLQSYEIVGKDKINLKVRLAPYAITVMTDRPYRKKTSIKSDEFINYIKSEQQKDLVFTLTIQKKGQPFLINFQKQTVLFSSETNDVVFEGIHIPKNVSDQLKDVKNIKGTNAVLIVEG